MPLLAKGSDGRLKSLAARELEPALDAAARVHLADGWWDWASGRPATLGDPAKIHAGELYTRALPEVESVLTKAAIDKRLKDVDKVRERSGGKVVAEGGLTNSVGMKFREIPAGKFLMGSPDTEVGHKLDEHPHLVRITKAFYIGVFTVTQGEYQRVMGTNPSYFAATGGGRTTVAGMDTSRFPVDNICWNDAQDFCRALSNLPSERSAGRKYRLPTEAEWEYACRAGTTTPYYFGSSLSSRQANFDGNSPYGDAPTGPFLRRTTTVGSYPPNSLGLYDLYGNVAQFCRGTGMP